MCKKIKHFLEVHIWNNGMLFVRDAANICLLNKESLPEQRESTAGNIHRLNETNDEFYDEIKAEFYCTECAKKLGYDTENE